VHCRIRCCRFKTAKCYLVRCAILYIAVTTSALFYMFYSKDKLGTHQTLYTDRANCWRYLRENLDIIEKILLTFFTTKLHSLICYSTHYKMDSYHELTSEQVSMGSKCEVGSACYSKHDARKIASENWKWQKN
jgi:hypothetical protein